MALLPDVRSPIRVLPPDVAARIAAGEVVERPASVVKELVENSLDAGATQVVVEVKAGGLESIRVIDNGCGIPASEVSLAFQRHATSKLSSDADLERVTSLGFRGEALPSIAAVSHLVMVTRTAHSPAGHTIELHWGQVVKEGPQGCPVGTSVTVRRLFDNVPARRKFLKSPTAEAGRIGDLMTRLALAFPAVRFTLTLDGRPALTTSGTGFLSDVLAEVYGGDVAGHMLQVQAQEEGYAVEGFVSLPSLTRANRTYVTLLVNRRWVQSRLLSIALEEAYHGLLQQGRHPLAVVSLTLPPQDVDVNIHPAKREVRFRHEDRVFTLVQRAVREVLMAVSPVPQFHLPTPAPLEARGWTASAQGSRRLEQAPLALGTAPEEALTPREAAPRLHVLGQAQNTYLVAEGPDGLYLIDQHAAHERVLYDRLLAGGLGAARSQALLEPVAVELTPTQEALVQDCMDTLRQYGFDLEPFGPRSYVLRAVPAVSRTSDAARAFCEVLDLASRETRLKRREDALAASIACHNSVRAGMPLSHAEMQELVRQLEATTSPNTCPHGRPTMVHLSSYHLEREFGRR